MKELFLLLIWIQIRMNNIVWIYEYTYIQNKNYNNQNNIITIIHIWIHRLIHIYIDWYRIISIFYKIEISNLNSYIQKEL